MLGGTGQDSVFLAFALVVFFLTTTGTSMAWLAGDKSGLLLGLVGIIGLGLGMLGMQSSSSSVVVGGTHLQPRSDNLVTNRGHGRRRRMRRHLDPRFWSGEALLVTL